MYKTTNESINQATWKVLEAPVGEGRNLKANEVKVLRRLGLSCSTLWRVVAPRPGAEDFDLENPSGSRTDIKVCSSGWGK